MFHRLGSCFRTYMFCVLIIPVVFSFKQSEFFIFMKSSLSGPSLSDWDFSSGKTVCNFTGVSCNDQDHVEKLDMDGWYVSGQFPAGICSYLPELKVLILRNNHLHGEFINSIANCSHLEELNLSFLQLSGAIPILSGLQYLRALDLSYNQFTGPFPSYIFNMTNLEVVNFNENDKLDEWELPEMITMQSKLHTMILTTCRLHGSIPPWIGNFTSLVDLELSGNFLAGNIPPEIGSLRNLQQLHLYYNYELSSIPDEIGNLSELVELDISVTRLTHIPESICRLSKLEVLHLYNNSITGEIPSCLGNSTTLRLLSLYENYLTGEIPQNLGQFSELIGVDLSENRLSGPLPSGVCKRGKLMYFLVLENNLSGTLPESFGECLPLLRFRVSNNNLQGPVPEALLGLPHVSIIDLSHNNFSGSISNSIRSAKNLSELFLQKNKISGSIPPDISGAASLVKVDLSYNSLSGPIPPEISRLRRLNVLDVHGNKLSSSIPETLSSMKSLNVLDLSSNLLTGSIPRSLGNLQGAFVNLSSNHLSGPIPTILIKGGQLESFSGNQGLCVLVRVNQSIPICFQKSNRKHLTSIWSVSAIVFIVVLAALLFLRRRLKNGRGCLETDRAFPPPLHAYEEKSFHRKCFDAKEIVEGLIEKNILGQGRSGRVYKVELKNGDIIAVKRLWSKRTDNSSCDDHSSWNKELTTEVETLGGIRHKNIIKLYSYLSGMECSLLVYEFMINGNLWDALHNVSNSLSWPVRHQIAIGVAQGLAYLHHDILPPIIHRDIKSTNILLDSNYQPRVADFGIAKVLQAKGGKESTTTGIAGTYGYLAPEYAYTWKATTKCDVYSFGVVLMEILTGRKPVEAEFGENKTIIYWLSTKMNPKEVVMEVFDKQLSPLFSEEMIAVLRIAMQCTSKSPACRPTMNEVVQMLMDVDPMKSNPLEKDKEASNANKVNNK